MQPTTLLASIAMLAAAISTPLLAGDREHDPQRDRQHVTDMRTTDGFDYAMQVVPNSASPDAPGHGWRYFTDPTAPRAVVISPQGDYYYSRGKDLRWIAAEQHLGAAWAESLHNSVRSAINRSQAVCHSSAGVIQRAL